MRKGLPIFTLLTAFGAAALAQVQMPQVATRETSQTPKAAPAASGTAATESSASQPAGLRLMWAAADHPSGLYYARESGTLTLVAENPTAAAASVAGQIAFGPKPLPGQAFKASSITPVRATTIAAGQRGKIELQVTFPAPGTYVLQWNGRGVPAEFSADLQCIFAPRKAAEAGGPAREESPWITPLPPAALRVPGYLADYAARTGIRNFLLDLPWSPEARVPADHQLLAQGLREAKAHLFVRLSLSETAWADARHVGALNQYLTSFLAGTPVRALALVPGKGTEHYRAYYLAAYAAAKKHDKTLLMLGTGATRSTQALLLHPPAAPAKGESLAAYVDLVAAESDPADVLQALARAKPATPRAAASPVWVLPPEPGEPEIPAAVLRAQGASLVPVDLRDRGVTAHLFGGAVLIDRLHAETPPYVAVFQGDGYAVAVIAGFGAGTPLDVAYPGLLGATVTGTGPDKHKPPVLEIADDTKTMRAVDQTGADLDCRLGDMLNVPVTSRPVYVLQAGLAEDLTGLLRTAQPHRLPVADVRVVRWVPAEGDKPAHLVLKVQNLSGQDLSGTLTVYRQAVGEAKPTELTRASLDTPAGKDEELALPVEAAALGAAGPMFAQVVTDDLTQQVPLKP